MSGELPTDDPRVAALQKLLKPARGAAPNAAAVAVALRLASGDEDALSSLSMGGARTRAKKLSERIVNEGLLQICSHGAGDGGGDGGGDGDGGGGGGGGGSKLL